MASTKERAFDAFAEHGPDAFTAAEWAERIDTSKDYVYQLRGDYKEEHGTEATEAEEADDTPEPPEESTDPTDDPPEETEPLSEPPEAPEGNGAEGPTEPSATTAEASAPTTPAPENSEPSATSPEPPEPTPTEPPADSSSSATAETDGGDIVAVGHEGKEKLSPAGFEQESVSSIDPPDGVELPEDVSPDDFEPDASASHDHDPEPEPQPDPEPEPEESAGGGGLLSRIRGDREATESTSEVVEEAPTDDEADRREQVLGALEGASGPTTPEEPEAEGGDESRNTSTMSNGLVMDEDLVASLFGMPFAQAANATGWDGWKLTDEEREANARLIVAYCDEQNIDLSAGGMLAMSLMSTVGGRAAGYARHRKREGDDGEHVEADPASHDHDPSAEPERSPPSEESEPTPEPTRDAPTETTEADDGEAFDFADSSTW